MMSFLGYVGTHDNNTTKIEIGKLVLGGVTLLGTLALKFYNSHKNNAED